MTRGKICVVKDGDIYISCEFNGDMGDYYGPEICSRLKKIKTVEDYKKFVDDFDAKNFGYKEHDGWSLVRCYPNFEFSHSELMNMKENYFKVWFSDYVYIRNLDNYKPYFFTLRDGAKHILPPEGIMVTCFGNLLDNKLFDEEKDVHEDEDDSREYVSSINIKVYEGSFVIEEEGAESVRFYLNQDAGTEEIAYEVSEKLRDYIEGLY